MYVYLCRHTYTLGDSISNAFRACVIIFGFLFGFKFGNYFLKMIHSSKLFKFYTLNIIPNIGKLIAKDQSSYRYLGESIQTYFSPDEIKDMLIKAGFSKIEIVNLPEDVASIHIGRKI